MSLHRPTAAAGLQMQQQKEVVKTAVNARFFAA
jgi:hypothetical protein